MSQSNETSVEHTPGSSMMRKHFEAWLKTDRPDDETLSKQLQVTYGVDLANSSEDQRDLVLYRIFLHDAKYWGDIA